MSAFSERSTYRCAFRFSVEYLSMTQVAHSKG